MEIDFKSPFPLYLGSLPGETFIVHNQSGISLPEQEQSATMKSKDNYVSVPLEEKFPEPGLLGTSKETQDDCYNQYDSIVST